MLIVGMGGTLRENSTSANAVRFALSEIERLGCETIFFDGRDIDLETYDPARSDRDSKATALVEALRRCDGIVVGSPGYHGSVSGLVKNALDYVEDMRLDREPYFDGRAVGCIACAAGWQAAHGTLTALRSIAHALRGWPTPIGVVINSATPMFDNTGRCLDMLVEASLTTMARQIVQFARHNRHRSSDRKAAV